MAFNRDSTLDTSLGTGEWHGELRMAPPYGSGIAWPIKRELTWARPGREITVQAISLLAREIWTGGLSDGTTLRFIDNTSDQSRAYVAATRERDTGKDIALFTGSWFKRANRNRHHALVQLKTLATLGAYVAATRARATAQDIAHWFGGLKRPS